MPTRVPDQPAIHIQLLDAIAEPRVRARVGLIIEMSIGAVEDLDSLDQSIYQKSQGADGKGAHEPPTRQDLETLARSVLEGVRGLDSYLKNCNFASDQDPPDDDDGMDFDFDLGGGAPEPEEMTLSDDDIAGALDGLAPQNRRSSHEQWTALSAEITSLSYALSSQLRDFDARFKSAMDSDRLLQGLRELDDVGNSLVDGVFALMSTICETYLGEFDRDQLLPGHRDTLGKALLVRRGLAELRRLVNKNNRSIQDAEAPDEQRQGALDDVAAGLAAFFDEEVFAAMRPADRLELKGFHEDIAGKTVKQGALSCEGMDKYLDSLVSVNQRDVLIKHDRELMNEVAELLEGVAPLIDISPHGALDMVRQAFAKADALHGYRDSLDTLLSEWAESCDQLSSPEEFVAMGNRLAGIVGPAN